VSNYYATGVILSALNLVKYRFHPNVPETRLQVISGTKRLDENAQQLGSKLHSEDGARSEQRFVTREVDDMATGASTRLEGMGAGAKMTLPLEIYISDLL
jgi:hypothetical protein